MDLLSLFLVSISCLTVEPNTSFHVGVDKVRRRWVIETDIVSTLLNMVLVNSQAKSSDNFITLRYKVPLPWKGEDVYTRETFFALSVATAITANAVEFMRYESGDSGYMYLFSYECMTSIVVPLWPKL